MRTTRDISATVGKVDIRKLEHYAQNDPDAYGYSGALCRANQGIMEFVEMFKAPIKVLHPLLTATRKVTTTGRKVSPPCRSTDYSRPLERIRMGHFP